MWDGVRDYSAVRRAKPLGAPSVLAATETMHDCRQLAGPRFNPQILPKSQIFEIRVYDDPASFLDVALGRHHRVVGAAPRPEAVAVLGESRVEAGLQDLEQGLLDEPVEGGGDAQLPRSSPALRDFLALHR